MSETIRAICGSDVTVAKGPDTLVRLEIVRGVDITNPRLASSAVCFLTRDESLQLAAKLEIRAGGARFNPDKGKGL